jgi:2'-5' RNA ligase
LSSESPQEPPSEGASARPLTYGILAYLDPASEARLTNLARALTTAGIPSTIIGMELRPHVSLASFECEHLKLLEQALQEFAGQQPHLEVKLDAIGVFPPPENILFLAPVVTPALLDLHDRVNRLAARFARNFDPLYQPGAWIPHITLGMELTDEQIGKALPIIRREELFSTVRLSELALLTYPPPYEVACYTFLIDN